MKGASLLRLAWFLAAILGLSAILFTISEPDISEKPIADSYEPGGTAAFAELLRRAGYQVVVAKTIPLSSTANSIPIAFLSPALAHLDPPTKRFDPQRGDRTVDELTPAGQYLRAQIEAGRSTILLAYNKGVNLDANLKTLSETARDVNGREYSLSSPNVTYAVPPELAEAVGSFAPASGIATAPLTGPAIYNLELVKGGTSVYIASGELAMNAFIDQRDNARFLLDAIQSVAPKGSRLVFIDPAVTGGGEPSVLDLLGPWASGALVQMFLVFVVIVYSLGKRFGLADETRIRQGGSRDLLEGIANTYTRARAGKAALAQIMDAQDVRVRRFLKLPVDSPRRKRNDLLPSPLANAFRAAEHLEVQNPTPDQALHAVRGLESEVNSLLGPPRAVKASRHRVKSR